MNIKIEKLTLTNFKCFRNKEFTFDGDITTIRGRNGVGKTTIFDAILFCLFGKNSQDQTKFDIKTHDENGNVIPHLDHSVELNLHIEGEYKHEDRDVTLIHSVKEKWSKKRGSVEEVFSGDTHEYFVNGELYTAADYKKYIASLIDEQTFRILTNPQYFPSLKWQDQRTILTQMVGKIDPEVIANTEELTSLMRSLQAEGEDIVAYKKHLGYQIKKIKEQLDKIPVRLEEQNKALPEKLDWDSLSTELDKAQSELKEIDGKIAAIQNGNGADVQRKEIANKISETNFAIDKLRVKAQEEYNKAKSEIQQQINQYSLKFNEGLNNQRLMDQTIQADERLIQRCEESIKDCGAELEKLRLAWPTRKYEIDTTLQVCPTCGQTIPYEQYLVKVEQMRENFNKALESEKQSLRDKAAKVKQTMEEAEKELQTTKEKLESDTKALEAIKEEINIIFSEKAKLEKEPVKTADEILAENDEYVELSKQLSELKASFESVTDSDNDLEGLMKLEASKIQIEADINSLHNKLASKEQYDKILSLIEGINAEQKDLVKQLSELEKKEDVARQYEDRQNAILEQRVNEHFQITRWKMFKTVVNGGDSYNEPYCECYDLNGTAYHDGLNQAARLNVGLDVINAMCRIYHVSAPVIIDQSESTLEILPTTGQQLRLCVSNCDLQIE